ncbi:SbcC/MukB-like Walker B domain-containing protein [Nonomuraea sp. NPDC059007]|uniref:SbcC/MukB-like Walker B domain-containing protein n=1 Tax=Nonomuraea sp. NPDC059007 TaxID=3346692 RepID=UPI003698DA9D
MTKTEHPAHLLAAGDIATLGVPGTDDRWQPTRAGMVNSWAWADETLLFADGWLALAGPNGSGKSLTASMLITLLLDAETSQTALSVSGKASGTLTSRHTDRNEREDRTGAWWLEYGLRDSVSGQTSYLTTGLWLRSTVSELQRAFFIVPGRVGRDLILQRDHEAIRIADLAEQLATLQGELFTLSSALRPQATAHLQSVGDERGYRQAVRTRLFAPLDEVQFEALIGVLRSLRSVRTAEAISPVKMREVLTDALPALEPDQLKLIAEAMERIAELENQLDRARSEAGLLKDAHRLYGRYLNAVSQLQAAELSSANNAYDDQTRRAREATEQLKETESAKASAEIGLKATRTAVSRLEGELGAADQVLSEHAGAELSLLQERADEFTLAASEADVRAEQATNSASDAAYQARESADSASDAQRHLNDLADQLRRDSSAAGAESAFDRLLVALQNLAVGEPTASAPSLDLPQLCGTPLAWVEARVRQIRRVQDVLHKHSEAQHTEQARAEIRRRAEEEEDKAHGAAEDATRAGRQAESAFTDELTVWSATLRHLEPPPQELSAPDPMSADGRLSPGKVSEWLELAAARTRDRIDVAGHRERATTDAALASQAAKVAADARASHRAEFIRVEKSAERLQEVGAEIEAESVVDEQECSQAYEDHAAERAAAEAEVAAARQRRSDGAAAVVVAAGDWLTKAHRWRSSLVFLDPGRIALPSPAAHISSAQLDALDPTAIRLAAHNAYAHAVPVLHDRVSAAQNQVQQIADHIDTVETNLAQARQAAPVPPGPVWRSRHPDDGVPLWALVDFADHLTPHDADRLEGALLVSGLLDALITPDGRLAAGDLVITARAPAAGRTLADLLRPESHPDLSVGQITHVLRTIPVDAHETSQVPGTLTHGVLTASCPSGYRAAYIGRTARERARRQRVSDLEEELARLEGDFAEAQDELTARKRDVEAAAEERDGIPPDGPVSAARHQLDELTAALAGAEQAATRRTTQADRTLAEILAGLEAKSAQRSARLAAVQQDMHHAEQSALAAHARATEAEMQAAELAQIAADSDTAHAEAARAQEEADAERSAFPHVSLATVAEAHQAEDRADATLIGARAAVIDACERHTQATDAVKKGLRTLNQAAALPDGSLLPTSRDTLDNHLEAVSSLTRVIDGCSAAARRCGELIQLAQRDARNAAAQQTAAAKATESAMKAGLAATKAVAHVAKIRTLYGTEYQELLEERQDLADRLQKAKNAVETLLTERQTAEVDAVRARSTLEGIEPHRAEAERRRDHALRLLGRLVDERLATLPDDMPADEGGRPANLTTGLTWAYRLLAGKPSGPERLNTLTQNRNRALVALENSVRTASAALARFNRQVVLVTVEDTEWRRAIIADPDATRGDDLDLALQALHASIAQLEEDLRDDVKQTMKTGMFTKLRRDIQVRRDAARELVRQIRATLREVRTGVANVGVQVDWDVRKDEDAQHMIRLITQPPSEATFEQMYTVLRQRMDETVGEPWPDRVAHTFDYRAWHEWDISVTHSSFGDGNSEAFRKVSSRSNPLESLSTGERRLATMLPLLAAAWSMYSGDAYRGPRLLSIDEIDAAFDEPNLRQILGLLRSWNFDVLATTPSISPMIKRESGRTMIHEVIAAGRQRITVPWLWEGHGDPQPLTLELNSPS